MCSTKVKNSIIYLTGFMGSGKSTVGPKLAKALGRRFFDLDEVIEKRLGKTIAQVFQEEGEELFRQVETETLKELSTQRLAVIALGGGAILEVENLSLVKETGVLICLMAEPAEIYRRVGNSDKRPLLQGQDGNSLSREEICRRIEWLLRIRQPYYEEADLSIETTGKSVEEIVEEILEKLEAK